MRSVLHRILKRPARGALLYAMLGATLWLFPLLGILHAESSAIVAGVAFFTAGLDALSAFARRMDVRRVMARNLALLAIPWAMLTMSMLWQPNCGYLQGLTFYLIFTVGSVVLGVSLAFLIYHLPVGFKRRLFVGAGLVVALLGVLYDIGFHPQFFTYNHVFGGVMGPIYDEELHVRGGLVAFRALSLVWAFWCVAMGRLFESAMKNRFGWIMSGAATLLLIGFYTFSAALRINSPAWFVRDSLGGHTATEHFDVYYAPASVDSLQFERILYELEYRYAFHRQNMQVSVGERIQLYLYPDPETKDHLTGARNTSVAPVWLREPQMHIVLDHFDGVIAHELGHVFSREFGLPVLRASLAVGLVEGVAVAFEPSDGRPLPHEQVLAASSRYSPTDSSLNIDSAFRLKTKLSPLGFWLGRGAVSYATMGSFVRFLVDAYGVQRFKRVYAWSNFEEVYGKSVDELVDEWEEALLSLPAVSRSAYSYVARRFSAPSLFEKECPHHVPLFEQFYRAGLDAFAAGDTTSALENLEASLREQPHFQEALEGWAQLTLGKGGAVTVEERLATFIASLDTSAASSTSPGLWVRLGDAYAITRQPDLARNAYEKARGRLPLYAQEQHGLLILRQELAAFPETIEDIYTSHDMQERIRRLEQLYDRQPLVAFQQAFLLQREGRYDEAVTRLENIDLSFVDLPRVHRDYLARLRLIALSQGYELNGEPEKALAVAQSLIDDFQQAGAFQEAAYYTDFADRMRYIGSG